MIITRTYAKRLAKEGKAEIVDCTTTDDRGDEYQIVKRYDLQRVDHYRL